MFKATRHERDGDSPIEVKGLEGTSEGERRDIEKR